MTEVEPNSALLEFGLKNLKSYWMLRVILTAVVLGIYLLFFLKSLLFGAAAFASIQNLQKALFLHPFVVVHLAYITTSGIVQ